MASLNELYRSIYQQLEAIHQADRAEKEQQRKLQTAPVRVATGQSSAATDSQ